jgi:hypothetical protein
VGEVRQRLADKLAYATVLTVLRTLEEKGYVGHTGEGASLPLPRIDEARSGRPGRFATPAR